MTISVVDQSEE